MAHALSDNMEDFHTRHINYLVPRFLKFLTKIRDAPGKPLDKFQLKLVFDAEFEE